MAAQPTTGAEALDRLLEGNTRFVAGNSRHEGLDGDRRVELAEGQAPFAVIVSCSDSRVPAEIVFDQGLGDVFLVRVAGNTASHPILRGSIEYGVGILGAVLLMVMGHSGCGAVTAALDQIDRDGTVPGDIQSVVDAVLPAARSVADGTFDLRLERAVRENVCRQVSLLAASEPVLAPAAAAGRLLVVGAVCDIATGRVELVTTATEGGAGRD
ncbi:MAG: carbonic anhydrase [Acidimicrobiales bacterium]